MGLRGNRRRARFKVVFNETNLLDSLQRSCQAMDSHRLTDGEVLVAQVNRQKCEAFLSALNRQLCLWLQGEKGQLAQFATFD
jgi:hypothetical protein